MGKNSDVISNHFAFIIVERSLKIVTDCSHDTDPTDNDNKLGLSTARSERERVVYYIVMKY